MLLRYALKNTTFLLDFFSYLEDQQSQFWPILPKRFAILSKRAKMKISDSLQELIKRTNNIKIN